MRVIILCLCPCVTRQVLTGIGGGASELEEFVFPLIYELHKVNPGIMLYIFPNISTQLQAEDVGVRSRAVGKC